MALHTFRLKEQASSCQAHGKRFMELREGSWQTFHGAKRRKLLQGLDEELECLTYWVSRLLDLWTSHASIQLEGSIMDWYQEVKEKQKQQITAALNS